MCEFDTEQKIQSQSNQTQRQTEMTYWGYKFEQYVTQAGELNISRVCNGLRFRAYMTDTCTSYVNFDLSQHYFCLFLSFLFSSCLQFGF